MLQIQVRFWVSECLQIISPYHYICSAGYHFKGMFYICFHLSLIPVKINPILQVKKVRSEEVNDFHLVSSRGKI